MGVAVDLGLSLKHHSFIVQWFNDLWLLLREEDKHKPEKLQINRFFFISHSDYFAFSSGSLVAI